MYHSSLPVTLLETLDTLVSTTLTTLFPSSSLSNRKEDEENEAEEEKEEKEQLMDLFVSMTHVLITLSQQDEVHDPVDVSTSSSLFTPRSVQRLVKFLDLVAHPPPPLQPSHQRGWSSSWRFKVLKEIGICRGQ
ncbi:hypothetical protein HMI56_001450 [Coelomomyces lativittatus]|nr:hypothetical protein HMI56_001450 [Coelomomyces lativittatus]